MLWLPEAWLCRERWCARAARGFLSRHFYLFRTKRNKITLSYAVYAYRKEADLACFLQPRREKIETKNLRMAEKRHFYIQAVTLFGPVVTVSAR